MKQVKTYLLLLACSIFYAHAQVDSLDNTKTEAHIDIPGTQYSMTKPDESFSVSKAFTGLQSEDLDAGINITELPMPFEQMLPMFAKDLPPKNGKLVFERDYLMNGHRVKLYKTDVVHKSTVEQLANPEGEGKPIIGWLMLYGDETFYLTIAGTYPRSMDEQLSDKFEQSLLSFLYEKDKEVDPMAGLAFDLKVDHTPLKFASVMMQTGAVFNMDGKFPSTAEDNTNYMVMVLPFSVEEEKQKDKAIRSVKRPSNEDVEIKEVTPVGFGGLTGYEVIGYNKDDNNEQILEYSVTLFDTDKHYIISGLAKNNLEEWLEMFRSISRSFKLR
ncbi:MAG: hypothetical protein AAGI38_18695 [Bacteroidota bacterium]